MSKEELLKYLIAEIDLIMHDKDYRFENANGTWYSRESCRDLTNEEVFEELRTELRQFADLEAKLAEKDTEVQSWKDGTMVVKLGKLEGQLAEKDRQLKLAEELLIKLEKEYDEQLEKQAKIHYRLLKEKDQDKISFALEQLEKAKEKALHFLVQNQDKLSGFYVDVDEIGQQIALLKGE